VIPSQDIGHGDEHFDEYAFPKLILKFSWRIWSAEALLQPRNPSIAWARTCALQNGIESTKMNLCPLWCKIGFPISKHISAPRVFIV
jgi:hypothetical protein